MKIEDKKIVSFHYTLTNEAGDKLDASHDRSLAGILAQ